VLPSELPAVEPSEKMIPRKIWVAVKDANDEHPKHLLDFFGRNPTWQRNICDNACKDKFMNTTFGGTALHWAYYMINPAIGAARADIWRYCVLYTFGGLYLDDDSDIGTLLDEVSCRLERVRGLQWHRKCRAGRHASLFAMQGNFLLRMT
jgi:mannosyltransferase OCH1-like enzyme